MVGTKAEAGRGGLNPDRLSGRHRHSSRHSLPCDRTKPHSCTRSLLRLLPEVKSGRCLHTTADICSIEYSDMSPSKVPR